MICESCLRRMYIYEGKKITTFSKEYDFFNRLSSIGCSCNACKISFFVPPDEPSTSNANKALTLAGETMIFLPRFSSDLASFYGFNMTINIINEGSSY